MNAKPGSARPPTRDEGQYRPCEPNPDFPHWGRDRLDQSHAIFAIVAHLRSLALEQWAPRVVRWLAHYDGFERWVDEGEEPCMCVRDLLARHVARFTKRDLDSTARRAGRQQRIVDELVDLSFLRYRAYWGRGLIRDPDARIWQPLRQPWLEFVDSEQPEEALMVFRSPCRIVPTREAHRRFLLQA